MTQQGAVSVVIPAFNRRDVILRAVESILRQEGDLLREVVVVDDGSTDGTGNLAASLGGCVRVVRQQNQGAAAARRRGILEATAPVLAFLDSDDQAEPHHLLQLWDGLQRSPAAVLAWARVMDLQGMPFRNESQPADIGPDGLLKDPLCAALQTGCFTVSMNLMTYREIAIRCTEAREHVLAANDYDFTLRAATEGAFSFVDEYTVKCDRRSDGISRTRQALQAGFAVIAAFDAVHYSRRRDERVCRMLRHRVGLVWPAAFAQLLLSGHPILGSRVARIGMRTTGIASNLRPLWWAIDHELRSKGSKACRP